MRRVPQKPVLRTRISAPYQRRGFPVPNITPVPEKPVFYRVPLKMRRVPQEPCFAHRAHIPYHRRPSPVPNATNTTQSHPAAQTTASSTPSLQPCPHYGHHLITDITSLQPCPHYGHPPHGSRLGQETTALRKNLCNFFKKLRELSRSFFIFVPNKYRNTQCKLFTTNTTNSWNLPR